MNVTSKQETRAMSTEQLLIRTKSFAIRVMKLVDSLPNSRAANVVGNQVLRSATSVGANYRAARRARSPAEFCSKLGIAEEEADESVYWLELLIDAELVRAALLKDLLKEANELIAMIVASIRIARSRKTRGDRPETRSSRRTSTTAAAGPRADRAERSSRRTRSTKRSKARNRHNRKLDTVRRHA
jgi:four helix bundle protein